MPVLIVGDREIGYQVRRSDRAERKRIEVTPNAVEVIAPAAASEEDIVSFVRSKRRWIHDQTEILADEVGRLRDEMPIGFHSGAKVLFRGRYLMLRVRKADVKVPSLTYETRFHVQVPENYTEDEQKEAVRGLLHEWFEERLIDDAWTFIRRRGKEEGLVPKDVRVKEQKTLWGSCGKDRVLRLDRKLIRVPKPVFEYVVGHEICHLRYREHSPRFWALVKKILPDYEERKDWLDEHEVSLG